ncbi:unnamed protein product [Tenebrio molitor]|nr:unnamed protein product [Tenebrio molitor]
MSKRRGRSTFCQICIFKLKEEDEFSRRKFWFRCSKSSANLYCVNKLRNRCFPDCERTVMSNLTVKNSNVKFKPKKQ